MTVLYIRSWSTDMVRITSSVWPMLTYLLRITSGKWSLSTNHVRIMSTYIYIYIYIISTVNTQHL